MPVGNLNDAAGPDGRVRVRRAVEGKVIVVLLTDAIEAIFSNNASGTTLATVHKAKGLEAPRVFILNPDGMPSKWARQEWQMQQERNLQYVAVTRALETLVYLPLEIVGA